MQNVRFFTAEFKHKDISVCPACVPIVKDLSRFHILKMGNKNIKLKDWKSNPHLRAKGIGE